MLRPLTKVQSRNIAWLRDPDVVRFSEQRHQSHTLSSQLRYLNSFGGKSHIWGVYLADTGDYIGNVTAMHDEPNRVTGVGIMIGETKHWGKGYAREAWSQVCTWLLMSGGGDARKLESGCAKSNVAMVKIIQGSGFKLEGERLNHFLVDGSPISMVLYGRMP